jgi:hypothetical protein
MNHGFPLIYQIWYILWTLLGGNDPNAAPYGTFDRYGFRP